MQIKNVTKKESTTAISIAMLNAKSRQNYLRICYALRSVNAGHFYYVKLYSIIFTLLYCVVGSLQLSGFFLLSSGWERHAEALVQS